MVLEGLVHNTLKVHCTPESGLLTTMRSALGDKICTEGGVTKLVELGGKKITSGLSGSMKFIADKGCVFVPKCNVDPESDCRVVRTVYEIDCQNCLEDQNSGQTAKYVGTSGRLMQTHKNCPPGHCSKMHV